MRVYVKDEKPTTEFSEYLEKVEKGVLPPPPSDSNPSPTYITEDEQKRLMAEGKWALPPAIQHRLDKENQEDLDDSNV